jgi:hypothetical protein
MSKTKKRKEPYLSTIFLDVLDETEKKSRKTGPYPFFPSF